ncbi:putative polyketide synthase [Aspergillus aurantiobrunneus]
MTRPKESPVNESPVQGPFRLNLGPDTHSANPELLVAAAWAIIEARWFYKDEANFKVLADANDADSAFRVRAAVGGEVNVDSLLQQLQKQISLGGQDHSRNFRIVYEAEIAKNKDPSRIMLDCAARGPELQMTIESSSDFQPHEAGGMSRSLQRLLEQLTDPGTGTGTTMLTDLDIISEQDLAETWERNAVVPPTVETPVHESIQLNARTQGRKEAPAVCARDGSFTYEELDELATRVALGLRGMGVKKDVLVPLYFHKSKWMPVAILGVLKAGGAFLQLAQSIPRGRIEAILSPNMPPFALVGSDEPSWLSDIVPACSIHELLARDHDSNNDSHGNSLPECSPAQEAVRLFTSGSTGKPKGIVWTHATLATNCKDIRDVLSLGPGTRHFQTASYEFDVSMMETLAVLVAGGCLCIPLEDEGVNCSADALAALQGNTVYLTPTIARGLDPDTVPTLRKLALEGEILPKDVVARWAGKVTMYNFYGPAECPHTASCVVDPDSFSTGFAGSSAVSLRWVVDPQNDEKLMPHGAIGELLVEGPVLLDRYVGEGVPAHPFVTPTWLQRGHDSFDGRKARLFKTGDLVRCTRDGDIVVLGRKDMQVQVCAERVELAEVEHHVRGLLGGRVDVVAEMITPVGYSRPVLAAFLAFGGGKADLDPDSSGARSALESLISGLEGALALHVPRTFIPALYVAVERIPVTAAGKTNRRELREVASDLDCSKMLGEKIVVL